MRIHIVAYLPRGERSATKRLLDAAYTAIGAGHAIDRLDLHREVPDLFTPERLWSYISRDYLGTAPDAEAKHQLAGMDALVKRLQSADVVVLAAPMHNFGPPAIVKAWFDAVMLKGHTWDITDQGYVGRMGGRKALILSSAGGVYEGTPWGVMEHMVSLCRAEFQFLGYTDIRHVFAQGMNALPEDEKAAALAKAEQDAATTMQALLK